MVKCDVCGRENSDEASACVSCGDEGLGGPRPAGDVVEARLFRGLVVYATAVYAASVCVGLDEFSDLLAGAGLIDGTMREALKWNGYQGAFLMPAWMAWVYCALCLATRAALWRFSWPARLAYTGLLAMDVVWASAGGLVVATPWNSLPGYTMTLADGAILLMAWTRPLKGRFVRL